MFHFTVLGPPLQCKGTQSEKLVENRIGFTFLPAFLAVRNSNKKKKTTNSLGYEAKNFNGPFQLVPVKWSLVWIDNSLIIISCECFLVDWFSPYRRHRRSIRKKHYSIKNTSNRRLSLPWVWWRTGKRYPIVVNHPKNDIPRTID